MRTFRRIGNYGFQVGAGQQFMSALWLFGGALIALGLTEGHGWWFALGIVIAIWLSISGWQCMRVGFQILFKQGEAMTRVDRPWSD